MFPLLVDIAEPPAGVCYLYLQVPPESIGRLSGGEEAVLVEESLDREVAHRLGINLLRTLRR